jgi:hypothetical protein
VGGTSVAMECSASLRGTVEAAVSTWIRNGFEKGGELRRVPHPYF